MILNERMAQSSQMSENKRTCTNSGKDNNAFYNKNTNRFGGLNNGFILDEVNNCHTISQGSSRSIRIQNSEESRSKIVTDSNSGINKKMDDQKIYKINQRMENIKKTNYHEINSNS